MSCTNEVVSKMEEQVVLNTDDLYRCRAQVGWLVHPVFRLADFRANHVNEKVKCHRLKEGQYGCHQLQSSPET
jgi:hypothetical protein